MANSSKKKHTSSCFSTIIQHFVCARNLPTHPTPPESKPEKTIEKVPPKCMVHAKDSPGLVARLMGLDSLPTDNTKYDYSIIRSKSLNSLHFLPEFDPARASFHRRARTSASFHEQGGNFLVKVGDNFECNVLKFKEAELGRGDVKKGREKVGVLKEKNVSRMKSSSSSSSSNVNNSSSKRRLRNNNVGSNLKEKYVVEKRKLVKKDKRNHVKFVGSTVTSKKRVVVNVDDNKEEMSVEFQSDALSRSPVSVLDHHYHEFDSSSKDDPISRQATSSPRRKSKSAKIKCKDDMPLQESNPKSKKNDPGPGSMRIDCKDKLMEAEGEVAEYFVKLIGQISNLAEEHVSDPKWMRNFEGYKVHCIDNLCMNLGEEMLEFMLCELLDELIE